MPEPYESREKHYWDERIRRKDRYTAIGRQSLPRSVNRLRKESLFPVIDAALKNQDINLAPARVLDAGCGTGIYSEHYASTGARVVGIDLSHEALRSTRKHGVPGEFCVASLPALPFPDGHFDLTHAFSVLYHIVDDRAWRASLRELCRVTRPDGHLMMRIEWVERSTRIADHVKHRAKDDYLRILTEERDFVLEGVYPFSDVVRLQPLFVLFHRILPTSVSEHLEKFVESLDLLRENQSQKVVLFRKG